MKDVSLTKRAQQGDEQALLAQSEPDLRHFASRVCRTAADADDAVQHALITLSQQLATFRGMARLSTWLFTIVRNECRRYERLARRWLLSEEQPTVSDNNTPHHNAERAELLGALVSAIRQLRPDLRTVFVLREIEELDTESCARRLDISEGNVRIRLNRARTELRATLGHLI
jgi:RNA polymerase sigma factor (sigma-70 family)